MAFCGPSPSVSYGGATPGFRAQSAKATSLHCGFALAWELLLLEILMPAQGTIEKDRRKQLKTFLRALHLHGDLIRGRGTRPESEAGLRQELRASLQELAPELSARYTTLLRLRKFPLVCRLEGGTCTGCWMKVPAALASTILRVNAILQCPSCQRVLFSREWLEDP